VGTPDPAPVLEVGTGRETRAAAPAVAGDARAIPGRNCPRPPRLLTTLTQRGGSRTDCQAHQTARAGSVPGLGPVRMTGALGSLGYLHRCWGTCYRIVALCLRDGGMCSLHPDWDTGTVERRPKKAARSAPGRASWQTGHDTQPHRLRYSLVVGRMEIRRVGVRETAQGELRGADWAGWGWAGGNLCFLCVRALGGVGSG
jgi:hypothetical protein